MLFVRVELYQTGVDTKTLVKNFNCLTSEAFEKEVKKWLKTNKKQQGANVYTQGVKNTYSTC